MPVTCGFVSAHGGSACEAAGQLKMICVRGGTLTRKPVESPRIGADAPGYSAACSLSGPLPGLYVAGTGIRFRAVGCSAPGTAAACLRGQDWAAFREELLRCA